MRLRSLLFVPGDRPDRMAKALASGADAVILDLEDSISLEHKAVARAAVAEFLAHTPGTAGPADAARPARSVRGARKKLGHRRTRERLVFERNRVLEIENDGIRAARQRLRHAIGPVPGDEQQRPQPHAGRRRMSAVRRHWHTSSSR